MKDKKNIALILAAIVILVISTFIVVKRVESAQGIHIDTQNLIEFDIVQSNENLELSYGEPLLISLDIYAEGADEISYKQEYKLDADLPFDEGDIVLTYDNKEYAFTHNGDLVETEFALVPPVGVSLDLILTLADDISSELRSEVVNLVVRTTVIETEDGKPIGNTEFTKQLTLGK